MQEVFDGMGPDARRMRYLVSTPRLTGRMARRLSGSHPPWHVVLVAEVGGAPVGIGRFVRSRESPVVAEVALEVVDRMTGRGVGGMLLDHVVEEARAAGVRILTATVLPENQPMLGLLRARRAAFRHGEGVLEGELALA